MPKYTTGEIAKLCNVSVRTVQYYDARNILVPSELSEGGRRLYSEDDLKRMKIICFLREAGFSINSIGTILEEENSKDIVSVLIEQQEQALKEELDERQKKLDMLKNIRRELKEVERLSVESIGGIAYIMANKDKLSRFRRRFLIPIGVIAYTIEIAAVILWWQRGVWQPFAISVVCITPILIMASFIYFKKTAYICPNCHEIFKPAFKEAFWAYHTPKVRRLTCSKCNYKGLCVEVYDEKEDKNND
ncbi:MAG: MerR family transcriptional regulator [Clostridiales bacterium]|nr:MerR family transcriptional regulator [Clostridiales bacterium]